MINMASRLKTLRTKNKYSQKDFSAKLGVPLTTYNTWERSEAYPNPKVLLKIVDMYGVSLDYIYCRTDEMEKSVSTIAFEVEVNKLVLRKMGLTDSQIKKLTPEMTKKVYDFAEVVIKSELYDSLQQKNN